MSQAKFFFIAVLFFLLVLPKVVLAVDSPDDLYAQALNHYKEGLYEEALREFSLVLLYWPEDEQVKFYIHEIKEKDLPAKQRIIEKTLNKTENQVEINAKLRKDSVQRQLNKKESDEDR